MKIIRVLIISLIVIVAISIVDRANTPTAPNSVWTIQDSKAYARDKLLAWADKEWLCLDKLWTKESNWRSNAYNKVKVMGKNAGGIPQLLDLKTSTPPTMQIDRGLSYIIYRYKTPCTAWHHEQRRGWY